MPTRKKKDAEGDPSRLKAVRSGHQEKEKPPFFDDSTRWRVVILALC